MKPIDPLSLALLSVFVTAAAPSSAQKYTTEYNDDHPVMQWILKLAGGDADQFYNWLPLVVDETGVTYVQIKSMSPGDIGVVQAWTRKNYFNPLKRPGGLALSELVQYEIKCGFAYTIRKKYLAYYEGFEAKGHRLSKETLGDWWPIEPDSSEDLLARFICKPYVEPSSDLSAPGIK